jgi:ParB family transcriptional regulator, chromosome partitioning protein
MSPKTIDISAIDASDRQQPVDSMKAQAIAASIEETRLIQPIVARPRGDGYVLTAGGHRLAALILLGWTELTVGLHVIIKEEASEDDARRTEIYENIFRSPPIALSLAIQLCTAHEIHDARRGERRGRKSKIQKLQEDKKVFKNEIISSDRFTVEAAKSIGLPPVTISEYCRVGKALDAQTIEELRGSQIENNLNELKQLVEIPAEKRREAAAAIKRGEAKTVRDARVAIGLDKPRNDDPQARIRADVVALWGKASDLTKSTRSKGRSCLLDANLAISKVQATWC